MLPSNYQEFSLSELFDLLGSIESNLNQLQNDQKLYLAQQTQSETFSFSTILALSQEINEATKEQTMIKKLINKRLSEIETKENIAFDSKESIPQQSRQKLNRNLQEQDVNDALLHRAQVMQDLSFKTSNKLNSSARLSEENRHSTLFQGFIHWLLHPKIHEKTQDFFETTNKRRLQMIKLENINKALSIDGASNENTSELSALLLSIYHQVGLSIKAIDPRKRLFDFDFLRSQREANKENLIKRVILYGATLEIEKDLPSHTTNLSEKRLKALLEVRKSQAREDILLITEGAGINDLDKKALEAAEKFSEQAFTKIKMRV